MTPGFGLCNGHHESPMLDTFQANQTAGEFLDLSRFAMDNEDFEAGIMVEMRVTRRDHKLVIGVLEFS
jgi:hypothetical protein